MITEQIKKAYEHKTQFDILLIEDNPTDALLVQSHIEKLLGFSLHTVHTLSYALDTLNSQYFDLILLDLNLPDAFGLEGLIKLRHHVQKVPVVVLTGIDNEELGLMALQRGAQDYLIKGLDTDRLVKAIRYAIERIIVQDSENSKENRPVDMNTNSQQFKGGLSIERDPKIRQYEILTERELEVLRLLGKGCSNQEIALSLALSVNTVKTHIANILHKLSVSDRIKAIIEAQRKGLI